DFHVTGVQTCALPISAPLSDVVTELLETSDNQTSELLTKELGVEAGVGGSTSAGIGEISEVLDGLDLRGVVLEDGSGLALGNRQIGRAPGRASVETQE